MAKDTKDTKDTKTREKLVMVCMGVVTAAVAAMMYAQFGYSLATSVLAGGLAWCGFMLVHVQVRKSEQINKLKADIARLHAELILARGGEPDVAPAEAAVNKPSRATGRGGQRLSRPADTAVAPQTPPQPAQQSQQPGLSKSPSVQGSEVTAPMRLDPSARWEMPAPSRTSMKPSAAAEGQSPPPQPLDAAYWPGTSVSAGDPMRDQWAFRPNETALSEMPAASTLPPPHRQMPTTTSRIENELSASTIDADLEMVQRKIKALADEVNAAEAMKALVPPPSQAASLPNAIEQTIGALKITANAMRERTSSAPAGMVSQTMSPPALPSAGGPGLPADLFIPSTAQTIAISQPGQPALAAGLISDTGTSSHGDRHNGRSLASSDAIDFDPDAFEALARATAPPPLSPQVSAIAHAIEGGQMDVFLSPIVGLEAYDVRHYEVSVRLKSAAGTYVEDQDGVLQLAGPGLLALFDAARLTRTSIVADRLEARGKNGSVLSQVTGSSMTDSGFLETFARIYEQRGNISSQLVLTFTQADIDNLPQGAWQALNDMKSFGFRFALSGIGHLNSDFEDLAQRGFAFAKLPASALLEGMPSADHFVPPHDLCKRLAGAGLTLVAETIDQEAVRARVFGFGVVLGQGQLFGGARHVSLDPVAPGTRSRAA